MSNIFKNDQITPELNKEMNDLFMQGLTKTIRPVAQDDMQRISEELENAEGSVSFFTSTNSGTNSEMDEAIRLQNRRQKKTAGDEYASLDEKTDTLSYLDREKLLENLNLIYSNMIEIFKSIGIDDRNSEGLIDSIQAMEKSIDMVGGEVEQPFAPEDFVSGLESPDTGNDAEEKARRVIQNTLKFYKAGKVASAEIYVNEKDEKYIKVVFSGFCRVGPNSENKPYTATGFIGPIRRFIGVEAIDYIYRSPNGGAMYVRSFEGGRWINKSSDFDIIFDEFNVESSNDESENDIQHKEPIQAKQSKAKLTTEKVKEQDEQDLSGVSEKDLQDDEDLEGMLDFEIKEK